MNGDNFGIVPLLALLSTAGLVFSVVYAINARLRLRNSESLRSQAEERLKEAKKDADGIIKSALIEAKNIAQDEAKDFEKQQRDKSTEVRNVEKRLQKREEGLEKREKQLEEKEKQLKQKEGEVEKSEKIAQENIQKHQDILKESQIKLESIAGLTPEEAKKELMETLEGEARRAIASDIRKFEEEVHRTAEERARAIVATAIQRTANEFVGDACITVLQLPNDDLKGRIIGREGRNIRAIEQATGVDLIIDDTPEAIVLSCFNPVRREIAKIAIERLLVDGRIHPARIDEVVQKVTGEFQQLIQEAGERAVFELGIQNLHPELVTKLGELKYKTSGQQSILQHSIEVANIAGMMAGELDLNVKWARRAGLLHDIGKSLDQDQDGHHAVVGAELAKKLGEAPEVVEAIARHHVENLHNVTPLTVIVQAANTLSQFRPGARKEFLEKTVLRMHDVEKTVARYEGVAQAFVIRSGREVRAMISPTILEDDAVHSLARSVAKKIRSELNYPGQIKVTMVRETRSVQFAK